MNSEPKFKVGDYAQVTNLLITDNGSPFIVNDIVKIIGKRGDSSTNEYTNNIVSSRVSKIEYSPGDSGFVRDSEDINSCVWSFGDSQLKKLPITQAGIEVLDI